MEPQKTPKLPQNPHEALKPTNDPQNPPHRTPPTPQFTPELPTPKTPLNRPQTPQNPPQKRPRAPPAVWVLLPRGVFIWGCSVVAARSEPEPQSKTTLNKQPVPPLLQKTHQLTTSLLLGCTLFNIQVPEQSKIIAVLIIQLRKVIPAHFTAKNSGAFLYS